MRGNRMSDYIAENIILTVIAGCYLMLGVIIAAIFGLQPYSIVWFSLLVMWFPLLVILAFTFWISLILVLGAIKISIRVK